MAKDLPLKHAECLRLIDTLIERLPKDGVLTKFSGRGFRRATM